jgi:hypothetical protein
MQPLRAQTAEGSKVGRTLGPRRIDPSASVTGLPLTGELHLMALAGRWVTGPRVQPSLSPPAALYS